MWVEEKEWAYPIVYRPVSVDDEEVCEASSWKKKKKMVRGAEEAVSTQQ